MPKLHQTQARISGFTPSGFTLVELAIALMVIGLLIGGVLKGQELVNNARVTATMRQVTAYNTALHIFYNTYGVRPGDIKNPATRIPNCTAVSCTTPGNGNGRYTAAPYMSSDDGENFNNTSEVRTFWVHLAKANMITGINPDAAWTGTASFGVEFPEAAVGGGFGVTSLCFMPMGCTTKRGNAFTLRGDPSIDTMFEPDSLSPAVTAAQAAQIDRKMDDGKPWGGDVQSNLYSANCWTASGEQYAESASGVACNLAFMADM